MPSQDFFWHGNSNSLVPAFTHITVGKDNYPHLSCKKLGQ